MDSNGLVPPYSIPDRERPGWTVAYPVPVLLGATGIALMLLGILTILLSFQVTAPASLSARQAGHVTGIAAEVTRPTVIFLGDSLTEGFYASDATHTYVALIAARLGPGYRVVIDAKAGVDVRHTLASGAIPWALARHPAIIVVELGTNDGRDALALFEANYTTLLDGLMAVGHPLLFCLTTWDLHPTVYD